MIGGGDWSEDRLIPDCVRSWSKNKSVILRNPKINKTLATCNGCFIRLYFIGNKFENKC